MHKKTLMIKKIERFPIQGDYDTLEFKPGVNLLVGRPNTGKSQWMRMIDYLWGDPDSPEKAFDKHLAEKYERIQATVQIGEEEVTLERRWKEPNSKGKVFINGTPHPASDFSRTLLEMLSMPVVNYPSGNPFSSRKWPELSWRELYRHVYRKQRSWESLAAKQPDSSQLACLLYFLGIAEHLYSAEFAQLVELNKKIAGMESSKEQFASLLQQLSRELLEGEGEHTLITQESINAAQQKTRDQIQGLQNQKEQLLQDLRAALQTNQAQNSQLEQWTSRWAALQQEQQTLTEHRRDAQARYQEIKAYEKTTTDELKRMARAQVAGRLLESIKVTHCPVCDKPVNPVPPEPGVCFMCHQPNEELRDQEASRQRLEFEMAQIQAEAEEASELVEHAERELEAIRIRQRKLDENMEQVRQLLQPIQKASSAILPPELALMDQHIGQLQERDRQLERFRGILDIRKGIAEEIAQLEDQRDLVDKELEKRSRLVDFDDAANDLANAMNRYLTKELNRDGERWNQGQVSVQLREKTMRLKVDGGDWYQLGGTMSLLFLLSYNYALLSLTTVKRYRYPGLALIEMPAAIGDVKISSNDSENYAIEPFISLTDQMNMVGTQVIFTGREFTGLKGVHRITLENVWRQAVDDEEDTEGDTEEGLTDNDESASE